MNWQKSLPGSSGLNLRKIPYPIRFLTYAMTYGTHEDMNVVRQYVSDEELREVLDQASPGIFDARSWAYWNVMLGSYPAPPLPERQLD